MPKHSRPRRGSLQYWPRKRAKRIYPAVHWPAAKELKPAGFAGWKAGMTHVQYADSNPKSPTSGKTIARAATILECPPLFVCGIKIYGKSPSGLAAIGEKWSDKIPKELDISRKAMPGKKQGNLERSGIVDVRLIVATQPKKTGMAKKKPDVFELGLGGHEAEKKLEFAEKHLGKEISAGEVFRPGEFLDVSAVTKGYGFTGPVKRFGIRIQTRKDQQMHRHAGSIGSTVPRKVDWRVPLAGQYGFFTRTEYNKKLLAIGDAPEKINPKGGFVGYGIAKSSYMLVEGSVPGPNKRLVLMRKGVRAKREHPVDLKYISTESKQ